MMVLFSRLSLCVLAGALEGCRTPESAARPAVAAHSGHLAHAASSTVDAAPKEPVQLTSVIRGATGLSLTIVGTNDVHGWVAPQRETFPRGDIIFGGMPVFAGYLRILKEDNPGGVVLVDAGDLFQGTLLANLSEGAAVIDAFNHLGYDAAAIGNHEFDYGPIGPVAAASEPGMDAFGALKARIAQAKFPILSTNIYDAATGQRPTWLGGDGTALIERKGIRIGIVGLTTPQTPMVTLPINVASLRFGALQTEARRAAAGLRQRGADVVVAAVHAGGACSNSERPTDLSSCDIDSAEVFEMMNKLEPGLIDAVVAGHTHARIGHFVDGVPVIESWALGRFFGTIELFVDPKTRKVISNRTRIDSAIEICQTVDADTKGCNVRALRARAEHVVPTPAHFRNRPVVVDEVLAESVRAAEAPVKEMQERRLSLQVPAHLGREYEAESGLGSLLADSLRNMERADVALLNPGGLRADLRKGDLTYGAVFEVLPFDNWVATLQMTGEQLLQLLHAAYSGRKGVFQVSGLEVHLARCPGSDRLKKATLAGGKLIKPKAMYRVVMPDFLARGGDGLGPTIEVLDRKHVDFGQSRPLGLRDQLVQHWQKTRKLIEAPKPGRVHFVDAGDACRDAEGRPQFQQSK
jgi:5'-nucleotidase